QTCALPISSRRRHTRCLSDWSSDVCSSDHTSELQSLRHLVCRLLLGVQTCARSEEHTSELQSLRHLVCRLLLEKKENKTEFESLRLLWTSLVEGRRAGVRV